MKLVNQSLIRLLSVFIIMIVSSLFCVPSSLASPASEALVSEGRAILFGNIQGDNPTYSAFVAANDKFKAACAADPEDFKANLFYAITRLAAFALANGGGSTPETLMDLAELFGIARSESDYLDDGAPLKEKELYGYFYLDDTAPDGETVRKFLAESFIDVIDGSLSNLTPILAAFKMEISPEETGGDVLKVDYGDVQVLMSGLYTLKAFLHILTAYNLEVDIHRISVLENGGVLQMQRDLLDKYPDLLRLGPTDGAQSLSLARQALIDGINAFDNALNFISERSSLGNNLFYFGSIEEQIEAEDLLSFLVEIRNSLTGNRVAEFDEDFGVDVNRFFGNSGKSPLGLRAVLPEFYENDEAIPNTFPGSPVLNGIFPDLLSNDDLTSELDLQVISPAPVSVSGNITCLGYNGTGNVFIWAIDAYSYLYSRWFGPKLASGYTASPPGSYQLSGLAPGRQIILIAFWDKDDNGILTFGDFIAGSSQTIPDNGPLTLDLNITQEIDDNTILTKPGLYRVFGSNIYNIPDYYQGPWNPNEKHWGDGWTFIGESDKTTVFTTDRYYEKLLVLWHSGNRFNFDAVEDLVAGTALGEDAGGNPVYFNWVTSGFKNFDTDEWTAPSYFTGHRDRLYARTSDWYGFSLFPMPPDPFGQNTPRQLRLTLLSNEDGDMNGDNVVDLKDAIIVIQVLANYKPNGLYPNIHFDGRIGLEEAVQVLQMVSGGREE